MKKKPKYIALTKKQFRHVESLAGWMKGIGMSLHQIADTPFPFLRGYARGELLIYAIRTGRVCKGCQGQIFIAGASPSVPSLFTQFNIPES